VAVNRIRGHGAWGDRKGKKCARMAHFGAQRDPPQGSQLQATNKPPTSLKVASRESVPKWHTLRSKREPREGKPVFGGPHPRGNRLKPGFDGLLEVSAAGRSCRHAYPELWAYAPRSVKLRALGKRFSPRAALHCASVGPVFLTLSWAPAGRSSLGATRTRCCVSRLVPDTFSH
jgi:hypothetical protein